MGVKVGEPSVHLSWGYDEIPCAAFIACGVPRLQPECSTANHGDSATLDSWDGSVELAFVDQQANSLVARLAETLPRAEKD